MLAFLGLRELAAGPDATEPRPGGLSLLLDLGDPLRNRGDCLAFVQQRSIALQPPVTGPDLIASVASVLFGLGVDLVGACEDLARVVEVLLSNSEVSQVSSPGTTAFSLT